MKLISKVTVPKCITSGVDLIVIRRQEYEDMLRHLAEIKDAFAKIRKGEKELRAGKTRVVKSLNELRS